MFNVNQQYNLPIQTQIQTGNLRLKVTFSCGFVINVDLEKL